MPRPAVASRDMSDDGTNDDVASGERKTIRWVQYDAPLFVRVEPDENGWGTEITKVVLVVEPSDIHLARDIRGHFLVYDEHFERIENLDLDVTLDGIRGAVSVAEDKHRWPPENIIAAGNGWQVGPDPRDAQDYYLDDDELADDYEDDD